MHTLPQFFLNFENVGSFIFVFPLQGLMIIDVEDSSFSNADQEAIRIQSRGNYVVNVRNCNFTNFKSFPLHLDLNIDHIFVTDSRFDNCQYLSLTSIYSTGTPLMSINNCYFGANSGVYTDFPLTMVANSVFDSNRGITLMNMRPNNSAPMSLLNVSFNNFELNAIYAESSSKATLQIINITQSTVTRRSSGSSFYLQSIALSLFNSTVRGGFICEGASLINLYANTFSPDKESCQNCNFVGAGVCSFPNVGLIVSMVLLSVTLVVVGGAFAYWFFKRRNAEYTSLQ